MNNKKMNKKIEILLDGMIEYWETLGNDCSKRYGFRMPSILIYNTHFDKPYSDELVIIRREEDASMITLFSACGTPQTDIPYEDQIIESIHSEVFMSYERLFELIIECELDFTDVTECLKFMMRHEMGHIIDMNKRFIGKTVNDWNEYSAQSIAEMAKVPKMRKNASPRNREQWFLMYNRLPGEKAANDAIGITEEDIRNYCRMTTKR